MYLAVILDLFSRRVVGWSLSERLERGIALDALKMALQDRQPPQGLLHHSDRGSQYASHEYQQLLAVHGIQSSMSRKGNCWDNAVAESFFRYSQNRTALSAPVEYPNSGTQRAIRVHRTVLQPPAATFSPRLLVSQ